MDRGKVGTAASCPSIIRCSGGDDDRKWYTDSAEADVPGEDILDRVFVRAASRSVDRADILGTNLTNYLAEG